MISRSTNVKAALRSRQRGLFLNPFRFGGGGGGGPTDPDFANVTLLCHFNGTDGSTTITDNSPSPKTLTASGDAQIDTAQSKFGGASLLLDGTGDYVSTPANTGFDMGSGEFTIEAWVHFASLTGDQTIIGQCASSGLNSTVSFVLQKTAANIISAFGCQGSGVVGGVDGTTTVTANVWHHVAYVREANTFRLFLNGVLEATFAQNPTFNSATANLGIGRLGDFNGQYVNGWVDDVRVTKGTPRYTATFTPPTAQFPDA